MMRLRIRTVPSHGAKRKALRVLTRAGLKRGERKKVSQTAAKITAATTSRMQTTQRISSLNKKKSQHHVGKRQGKYSSQFSKAHRLFIRFRSCFIKNLLNSRNATENAIELENLQNRKKDET